MADLKWLEEYGGQSTDELIALEGEYRTVSLVLAFEQAVEQKAARVGFEHLTEEERIILAVEALEREVNNGGYNQFFSNWSKQYAPIVVDALGGLDTIKWRAHFLFNHRVNREILRLLSCPRL